MIARVVVVGVREETPYGSVWREKASPKKLPLFASVRAPFVTVSPVPVRSEKTSPPKLKVPAETVRPFVDERPAVETPPAKVEEAFCIPLPIVNCSAPRSPAIES